MKHIPLARFIKDSVEDEYTMNVFYSIVKRSFVDNDFSLSNVSSFYIDGRFLGEALDITSRVRYKTVQHALAFMLSVRLIMNEHHLTNWCEDDYLLLSPRTSESFQWVDYISIILDNWGDEEVKMLYSMLEKCHYDEQFSVDEKECFEQSILVPEYKNELVFYKSVAEKTVGVANNVIGNNTFLDSDIEEYVITKDVEYVGDTAFAYCENLETLEFEDKVLLGIFPIIECPKLKRIVVPTSLVDYYKENLSFYNKLICDKKGFIPTVEQEKEEETIQDVSGVDTPREENEEVTIPVDTSKLYKVFDKKATSYKYFWFLAIVSLTKEKDSLVLSYKDIIIRMAAMAWPIVFEYEIDLGRIDRLTAYLEEIVRKTSLIKTASSNVVNSYLSQHYASQGIEQILSPLLKNVPYRFLSPWISYTTDADVIEKSQAKGFNGMYALYPKNITLNKEWWDYIQSNYDDVCDFAIQSFKSYVKQYNSDINLLKLMMYGWPLIKEGK
jgi:hypothetical protein